MIGVIADAADHKVVREFFELFKTPWEFYSAHRRYDVVVCTGDFREVDNARLVVQYSGRKTKRGNTVSIESLEILSYDGNRIPVYGGSITFEKSNNSFLFDEKSGECAAYRVEETREPAVVRVGYDVFREVCILLTVGQPAANAAIPALDLHIALLRDIITGCEISVVEIPPVPAGYRCIACLTHDVDHPSIRQHRWDHTMFGFIYRAIFFSLKNLLRGRTSASDFVTNWWAVLKLPFVYLGVAKDFWRDFDDSYLKLENGLRSTFFVIPFKGRPGRKANGPAPAIRAASYGAQDIACSVQKLKSAGCEIGLHGIDAWIDASQAKEEFEEIRRLAGSGKVGVRMHWLYFDHSSLPALEAAGAAYDSTSGYNDTIGYRAGTTQIFKPLNTSQMLELPLHAMDTALFYPSYLGLSDRDARDLLGQLVDNTLRLGGVITINWHDRSLAPERLWGKCYRSLLQSLKSQDAWFATAEQAVSWFNKRRSASFTMNSAEQGVPAVVTSDRADGLPGLRLRVHRARMSIAAEMHTSDRYLDSPVKTSSGTPVASETAT